MPINKAIGNRLSAFPYRILTPEQARFIIFCLAYDRIKQKAKGARYHSYGLITKLARTFRVSVECIHQIKKRRTWRSINVPKPKQFFIELEDEHRKPDVPGLRQRGTTRRANVRPTFHSP